MLETIFLYGRCAVSEFFSKASFLLKFLWLCCRKNSFSETLSYTRENFGARVLGLFKGSLVNEGKLLLQVQLVWCHCHLVQLLSLAFQLFLDLALFCSKEVSFAIEYYAI